MTGNRYKTNLLNRYKESTIMQSQLILNYALQTVFCTFVSLLIFDFIDGLFCKLQEISFKKSITYLSCAPESIGVLPQPKPTVVCEIPDPWVLDIEENASPKLELVASLPKLYLLPPAKPQSRQQLLRKIEQLVETLAWDDFRAYLVVHKLGAKGKKAALVKALMTYCKTRTDAQLEGMVQELQMQTRRIA